MHRFASLLILLLLPLGPASADWLKTRDGALVETKGPWKVKGTLVIFTATNGALSSLRVSQVDLDASAVATAEAKQAKSPAPPAEAEKVEREPVLVLTNKDVPRAASATSAGQEAEAEPGSQAAASGAAGTPQTVQVISWRRVENTQIDGVEIVGRVRNQGREIATDLGVTVSLFDEEGVSVGTVHAFLGSTSLAPGTTTTVRALFPEVYSFFGQPRFEVRSKTIQVRSPRRPTGASGDES